MIWARLIFCWSRGKQWTLAAEGMSLDTSVTAASELPIQTITNSHKVTKILNFSLWVILPFFFSDYFFLLFSHLIHRLGPAAHTFLSSTLVFTRFLPLLFLSKSFFGYYTLSFLSCSVRSLCSCPAVLQCVVVCLSCQLGCDARDRELTKKKKKWGRWTNVCVCVGRGLWCNAGHELSPSW